MYFVSFLACFMIMTNGDSIWHFANNGHLSFQYVHFYNSTIATAISTDKMLLKLIILYSSIHFHLLIAGTILLLSWHRTFHSHANHKSLQHFFLGYFYSLTEYNYSHHGSNHIIADITQEDYQYITTCFLSFVRNLSKTRPTNNLGETLLAITLT